ncbi:MAG: tetratricopeptide repeat protein, partial [Nocardioides sp.]
AVQLAVTVAAAYYERGDTGQAVRTCRKAIDKAERLDSPKARASAYWNASMMESRNGSIVHAVPLAERALALLAEGRDGRNLARLRSVLADMQLQLDPPQVQAAHDNLERAEEELRRSSASAIDLARNKLFRAQATLLAGDHDLAGCMSREVYEEIVDQVPDLAAHACTIMGQSVAATGDVAGAAQAYRQAVMLLTGIGADRGAAQLWFELAGLSEDVGDFDTARTAYRSAAASAGLRSRNLAPTKSSIAID